MLSRVHSWKLQGREDYWFCSGTSAGIRPDGNTNGTMVVVRQPEQTFPHSRRRLPKAVQLHALCLQHPPLRPPQCGGLHPHPYLAAFRVSTQRRWLWLKQVCWLLHVSCVWQVMWAFTQYSRRLLNRLHLMPAAAICGRCCTCFLQTCYMSLMSLLLYFGAVSWIPPLL